MRKYRAPRRNLRKALRVEHSKPRRLPRRKEVSASGLPHWLFVIVPSIVLIVIILAGLLYVWAKHRSHKVTPSIGSSITVIRQTVPVPTITTTPSIKITEQPTLPSESIVKPDIPALQQFMLSLINDERQASGLQKLTWDEIAATAGLLHAKEMAHFGYISHWDLEGYGPDHRYSMNGGLNSVQENVYLYKHSLNIAPKSLEEWKKVIEQAHKALLESPLHRKNILAPEHTHVGIGIAYEIVGTEGRLAIAQEFVNRYVTLQALPTRVSLGDSVLLKGQLDPLADSPILNLVYEEFPSPMSLDELNATGVYKSNAKVYESLPLVLDRNNGFAQSVKLNYNDQKGLYHLRIWVNTDFGKVLTSDVIIEVK